MSENKDENLTLSRNNPITEFIRSGNFTDSLSQKETESKFSEFLSEKNKEKKKKIIIIIMLILEQKEMILII